MPPDEPRLLASGLPNRPVMTNIVRISTAGRARPVATRSPQGSADHAQPGDGGAAQLARLMRVETGAEVGVFEQGVGRAEHTGQRFGGSGNRGTQGTDQLENEGEHASAPRGARIWERSY